MDEKTKSERGEQGGVYRRGPPLLVQEEDTRGHRLYIYAETTSSLILSGAYVRVPCQPQGGPPLLHPSTPPPLGTLPLPLQRLLFLSSPLHHIPHSTHLARDAPLPPDLSEQGGADAVGGVPLVGVMLQDQSCVWREGGREGGRGQRREREREREMSLDEAAVG